MHFLRKLVRPGGLVVLDDNWAPSVRTAARYYERNLGWATVPDAFAGGSRQHVGNDPAAEVVSRCVAYRVPRAGRAAVRGFRPF